MLQHLEGLCFLRDPTRLEQGLCWHRNHLLLLELGSMLRRIVSLILFSQKLWSPPPQSWKINRMAARASGLHCPLVKNFCVNSLEMSFHTAGQLASPPRAKSWVSRRAKRGKMAETSGSEKAVAEATKRRRLEECIFRSATCSIKAKTMTVEALVDANGIQCTW
jgi:hypothetical protein